MWAPSRQEFAKLSAKFSAWLTAHGASMLTPTNEWELMRWTGNGGTSVIYTNARGRLSFNGTSEAAFRAFSTGDNTYRVSPPSKRRGKVPVTIKALRARDGNACFYCLGDVDDDQASVEHLVPVTHGGPSHMSNYVLAHQGCNREAGHASAMEKISKHVAALAANRSPSTPGEPSE